MKQTLPFDLVLEQATTYAFQYLNNLDHHSVAATVMLTDLRNRLTHPLNNEGMDAVQVIDDLVSDTAGGLIGSAGGRFFGWATQPRLPGVCI